jgi:hypothetical protein
MRAVQSTRYPNRQALARELVDHHQQAQTAPIVRTRFHEIVTPDVIAMLRSQSNTGAVVQPQPTARLVSGGNLQAFPPPNALHSVLAHSPAGQLQQCCDSPIPEPPVLARQGEDRLREPILVVALGGLVALRGAPLPDQSAGVPFTEPLVPRVLNGEASPHGT